MLESIFAGNGDPSADDAVVGLLSGADCWTGNGPPPDAWPWFDPGDCRVRDGHGGKVPPEQVHQANRLRAVACPLAALGYPAAEIEVAIRRADELELPDGYARLGDDLIAELVDSVVPWGREWHGAPRPAGLPACRTAGVPRRRPVRGVAGDQAVGRRLAERARNLAERGGRLLSIAEAAPLSHRGGEAVRLALAGYRIFPMLPDLKFPAVGKGGFHNGTTDPDVVARWWRWDGGFDLATRCDDVVVIDVDRLRDPVSGQPKAVENPWLSDRPDELAELYTAPTARTASGGSHHWFRLPLGVCWTHLNRSEVAPGVDVLTGTKCCASIAPPRPHPGRLQWVNVDRLPDPAELPELPDWLMRLVEAASSAKNAGKGGAEAAPVGAASAGDDSYREKVKAAAGNVGWKKVLEEVAGIPAGVLDGLNHPCPKPGCGGTDRFRLIDADKGAVLCNQCFNAECGDGLSAVAWMKNLDIRKDFPEVLRLVGEFVGVEPLRRRSDTTGKRPPLKAMDPAEEVRAYLGVRHRVDGVLTLRFHSGAFLAHRSGRYVELTKDEVDADVVAWLSTRFTQVTTAGVANFLLCLKAETLVPSKRQMPCWLGPDDRSGRHFVSVRNGLLDIEKAVASAADALESHSPFWLSTTRLSYDFDPAADCPTWKRMLGQNLGGDTELIALLQEWFGYCLTKSTDQQRFLLLTGEAGSGKSTTLAGFVGMLGLANISTVPLERFGDRFAPAAMYGMTANVAAEIGEIDRVAEGNLKQLTSGDPFPFERKFRDLFTAVPTARLVFATNTPPRFRDRTDGVWRRMVLVPFDRKVRADEKVEGADKPPYWERLGELPGLLNWAIEGLRRLRRNGAFTRADKSEAALHDYRDECNPVRLYLADHSTEDPAASVPAEQLYGGYRDWAEANGYRPLCNAQFGKELRRIYPTVQTEKRRETFKGSRKNYYIGIRLH